MRDCRVRHGSLQHLLVIALAILLLAPTTVIAAGPAGRNPTTLVLADPQDPYYSLARELADRQKLPLSHSFAEALAHDPVFLLWVVSPEHLSEELFAEWGRAIIDHPTAVSLGLISGSTRQEARALLNRQPSQASLFASVSPHEGRIEQYHGAEQLEPLPLDKENLVAALGDSAYLVYRGHGTRRDWHISDDEHLTAADLPLLPNTAINALACQTFKLWSEDSIALGFTDRGACAYIGFVHSPQGYVFGEPEGFPLEHTWPDYPIGHLVQVQNRGLCQGHIAWPYYMLLGDPRLALGDKAPYQVVSDETSEGIRTLHLTNLPAGIVPIRIADGAEYAHVRVEGGPQAWRGDPFYDSDLQMVDIGPDKFLLLDHGGGDVTIALRPRAPLLWQLIEPLADAPLHMTLVTHAPGSLAPNLALLVIVWLAVGWVVLRRGIPLQKHLWPALCASCLLTAARGLYALLCRDQLAALYAGYLGTQSIHFVTSPWVLLSGLFLTTGGIWLLYAAKRVIGRALALWMATAPLSLIVPLWFGASGLPNLLARQRYGGPLYGYAMGSMALIAWALEALLLILVLVIHARLTGKAGQKQTAE